MTTEKTKTKMTTKQKVSTVAMLLIVIGATWWIYNQWVSFNKPVVDPHIVAACQDLKNAIQQSPIDLNNPSTIADYNGKCGSITGGL